MGRRCGLEVVGGTKMWFGRSGRDEDGVWKEWVGRRWGLGGMGGTKMGFERSGWDEDGV